MTTPAYLHRDSVRPCKGQKLPNCRCPRIEGSERWIPTLPRLAKFAKQPFFLVVPPPYSSTHSSDVHCSYNQVSAHATSPSHLQDRPNELYYMRDLPVNPLDHVNSASFSYVSHIQITMDNESFLSSHQTLCIPSFCTYTIQKWPILGPPSVSYTLDVV